MGLLSSIFGNQQKRNVPVEVAFQNFLETSGYLQNVSVREATGIGAVFACRAAITESFCMLPVFMIKELENSKIRHKDHELNILLRDRPNPHMDSFNYFEKCQNDLLDHGNTFSFVEKDRSNTIINLWPLQADKVEATVEGRNLIYIDKSEPKEKKYKSDEILHVRDQTIDGVTGRARLKLAGSSVTYAKSLLDYGNAFFKNGAMLGGMLSTEFPLKTEEEQKQLLESFTKGLSGATKNNKVGFLPRGVKYDRYTPNAREAQVLEALAFSVIDIARIYRVPPHMIQDLSKGASYSSIEQMAIAFVQYSIQPWVTRWERALRRWLLFPNKDERDLHVKFNISALIRGDLKSRTEAIVQQLQYGLKTLNEARALLDENPVNEPMADKVLVSHNLRPLSDLGKEEEEKVEDIPEEDPVEEEKEDKKELEEDKKDDRKRPENDDFKRFLPLFRDLMGRVLRRISAVAESHEKRGAPEEELLTSISKLESVFIETFSSANNCVNAGSDQVLAGFWRNLMDVVMNYRQMVGPAEFKDKLADCADESASTLLKEVMKYAH